MAIIATGGTTFHITVDSTEYVVHRFTSAGTFTVESGSSGTIEYLLVGGGGGGGDSGGGGGGGGITSGSKSVVAGNYPVSVGDGGNAGSSGGKGGSGGTSSVTGLAIATSGGGGGGGYSSTQRNGSSGACGGGGAPGGGYGGGGSSGYAGGSGDSATYAQGGKGGGGGGAGSIGGRPGGGSGFYADLDGTVRAYGSGGTGYPSGSSAGTNGLGSGGGGGYASGPRPGGSGVVVIRYPYATHPNARVSETQLPQGDFSTVVGGILSHSDSRVSLAAPLYDFAVLIDRGPPPAGLRWSAGLACGEFSVQAAETPWSRVSLSLDTLIPFAPTIKAIEMTFPVSAEDFASHHVWYETQATAVEVVIPDYSLSDIPPTELDPTTGDWREVLHRILLRASIYYDDLADDLRSPKGAIVQYDDYQAGLTTLQRQFTLTLGVDFDESTVAEE